MTTIDAQPTTDALQIIPVSLTFGRHDIDELDVCNPEIVSDTCERIEVGHAGPLFGRYLRIEANDLVDVAGALHRLADRITHATFDARDEKLEAERHDCYCGTRLERDEITCGAEPCNQRACAEAWADEHSGRF